MSQVAHMCRLVMSKIPFIWHAYTFSMLIYSIYRFMQHTFLQLNIFLLPHFSFKNSHCGASLLKYSIKINKSSFSFSLSLTQSLLHAMKFLSSSHLHSGESKEKEIFWRAIRQNTFFSFFYSSALCKSTFHFISS